MVDSEIALPPNWRAARDSDGKEYYFNELTGETSWIVPEDAGASAPPAMVESGLASAAADSSEFAPRAEPASMMSASGFGAEGGGRGRSSSYAEFESLMGERVLPRLLLIMFCSFVVMLQSSIELGRGSEKGTRSYGIAVGSISLAFSLGLFVFAKLRPSKFSNFVVPKLPGELSLLQLFAIFQVLWWTPAMIVLTFFNPFTATTNAYFAAWAALVASLLILGDCFARVGDKFRELSASRVHEDAHAKVRARPFLPAVEGRRTVVALAPPSTAFARPSPSPRLRWPSMAIARPSHARRTAVARPSHGPLSPRLTPVRARSARPRRSSASRSRSCTPTLR